MPPHAPVPLLLVVRARGAMAPARPVYPAAATLLVQQSCPLRDVKRERNGPAARTITVVKAMALAAMAAALLASGCSSDPAPGLSQQQAVATAGTTAQRMSSTPVSLISVTTGDVGDVDPNAGKAVSPPDRRVWAVVFHGTFPPPSCGPAGGHCPAPNTTMRVILDYASGTLIEAETYTTSPGSSTAAATSG